MKYIFTLVLLFVFVFSHAQRKSVAQMKAGLQKAQNPMAYARDSLKKRYVLDTIIIPRIGNYQSIADSLGYKGQIGKVYGPYDKGRILVQVLAKLPNTFHRISQIYLDAAVFSNKFADSLSDAIIKRVRSGSASFEQMAQTYSMGGEGITKGDLGWIARGVLIPEIDKAISTHKKGDIFKVRSNSGVHIIKITENAKQDHGFALIMRVFL